MIRGLLRDLDVLQLKVGVLELDGAARQRLAAFDTAMIPAAARDMAASLLG